MILGSSILKETPTCLPTIHYSSSQCVLKLPQDKDEHPNVAPGGSQGNGRQQTEESLASVDCIDIIMAVYVHVYMYVHICI